MNRKMKIGNFEAVCLILNMTALKTMLDFPRTAAEDAGTAGWLMTLLVSVVVIVLFSVISGLYRKFAGYDILDVGKTAMGNIGKMITGILFMLQFLLIIPVVLREFAEDIKVISLPSTPISIILLLFCTGMVIGAWLGLETLARIHALMVPVLASAFAMLLFLNVESFNFSRLAPWLGLGGDVILRRGMMNLSLFSEFIVLFFIVPFLNKKSDFGGIGRYGLVFSSMYLVLTSLCYSLIYEYPTTTELFLPMYQMAREINLGRFFTRIESAFIIMWASSAFLYLSSGLYFITWLFKESFGLKYQKPLILPFIILVFTLSIIPENLFSTLQIEMELYRSWSWIVTFLFPLLLILIASMRVKRKKGREVSES
ncbi:MAG: endospore germination permease [Ruminiclostridium sp.]|nr:endospore germination permease [Ruminiclostridium sp.]